MSSEKLPIPEIPKSSVEIGGVEVHFHSLSRSQAIKVHSFLGREDEAEDFILSSGTGLSLEEAHAWRDSVTVETAGKLIDGIIMLSGLVADPKAKASK